MQIELIKRLTSDNEIKKNILVIGVFHGDENQGEYVINRYLKACETAKYYTGCDNEADGAAEFSKKRRAPQKNDVYYIPRLNFSKTRVNKNGVDLNRNFPAKNWELSKKDEYFGGNSPASEDETKFIVSLMENVAFDAIITIHAPYKIVNYDGDRGGEALFLANKVSKITGYPVRKDIGYPTPGSFGTYAGVERDIPTITVEVDEDEPCDSLYLKFERLFAFLEDKY